MRTSRLWSSLTRRTPVLASPFRPRDESKVVKRLAIVRPDLIGEWVPHMNDIDVSTVSINATEAVVWCCSTCQHQWTAPVRDRAIGEGGCPECARRASSGITAISNAESLAQIHPWAVSRWDVARNGALRPSDVTPMSTRAVWWLSEDGKESFRRPVYTFVRENRSLREAHIRQVDERVAALRELAPLVGYAMPETIDRTLDGFSKALPGSEQWLAKGSTGMLSEADLLAFEEMWCKSITSQKKARQQTDIKYDESFVSAKDAKKQTLTLRLDTSLSPRAPYQPAVPVLAMLDYHAEQVVSAAQDAQLHANPNNSTPLPSYLLDKASATEVYTLPETTRARINAHRIAANRLKFKAQRPFAAQIKTREMPTLPSPDAILEAEAAGRSTLAEVTSPSTTDADFHEPSFRRRRSGGFRRNQSLEMPQEMDEAPSTPLGMGNYAEEEPAPEPTPAPASEIEAPAAPRVVGRRKKK